MKCLQAIGFGLVLLISFRVCAATANSNGILNKHRQYLLRTNVVNANEAQTLIQSFDKSIQGWPNIDYSNGNPAEWQIGYHVKNILTLAIYTASNPKVKSRFLPVIVGALDKWYAHRYQSQNWWHNEIGIPQMMRDILVLLKDDLNETQLKKYLQIVNQFRINGTGANLIWSADIGLYYGLFTNDFKLVNKAVSAIVAEIKISEKEGLQPDYSFHQHGARLQMYQYGKAFLVENIRLAWELKGTQWAYPVSKVNILADMFLKGWQWMARGIHTVPETMDRSASRKDALNEADIRKCFSFFIELAPQYKKDLVLAEANQNGGDYTLKGFRGFVFSDFSAFHSKEFSFFLKTISTRTLSTESINFENLKGRLLNSGETYFVKDGSEYFNLLPVWNWEKLPGITAFNGAEKIQRNDYNGIVTDGNIGLTSVNYKIVGKSDDIFFACKKSWFNVDGMMICLMSDMMSSNVDSCYTVMDQARLKQPVIVDGKTLANGSYKSIQVRNICHNNFEYIPFSNNGGIDIYADKASGSWYDINHSYSGENILDSIFMPVIYHDSKQRETGYIVCYVKDKVATEKKSQEPTFDVLKNDRVCQAIRLKDQSVMAAFYEKCDIAFNDTRIEVSGPCLIMICGKYAYLSDPLHKGEYVNFKYNSIERKIKLREDGGTIQIDLVSRQ